MSSTLYRKYRPATFSEIIGQKHIVQTLKNSVKSGRIGHAYLFAGPRGTGKTSIARIFAKSVNCPDKKTGEPCLKCESCKTIAENRALDIIEIDAASNTGVDNIRELKETINLRPSSLKYKVYIIDEAHMLSGGAFNALLKTLEEPPAHVIFILATTEVHKIPETILSRVQRFDFTRLTIGEIKKRLEEIAKLEKVKVDSDALETIAAHSEGGMRNAESLLGQIIAFEDKQITAKEVSFILGTASERTVTEFASSVLSGDIAAVFSQIGALREAGADFKNFGKDLLNYFRQMLVVKINPELGKKMSYEIAPERLEKLNSQARSATLENILGFINNLQKNIELFKNSPLPHLYLEVATAGFAHPAEPDISSGSNLPSPHRENLGKQPKPQENNNLATAKPSEKKTKEETAKKKLPEKKMPHDAPAGKAQPAQGDLDLVIMNWPGVIEALKSYNHSLSSVLKMSQPAFFDGKNLVLRTKYSFYKDKIAETKNRLTIEEAIAKITGVNSKLRPLTEKEFKDAYGDIKQDKSLLQEAMDIFGGKIVSE